MESKGGNSSLKKNPPLPTPFPALRLPTSGIFRLIQAFYGPTLYLPAKKDALIPLHTSLSVIYGHVTNYPKLNDIKQPPVFSSSCILQVRSLEKAWRDSLVLLLHVWAFNWEDLKGRDWSHLETSWFTNAWCLCRVGLNYDC